MEITIIIAINFLALVVYGAMAASYPRGIIFFFGSLLPLFALASLFLAPSFTGSSILLALVFLSAISSIFFFLTLALDGSSANG